MQARAIDWSPVIDQRGELLGTLSKNKMNRNVGGFRHDSHAEPVEAHIEKNNAYCFEDQTIAEAEQMMLNAKIGEVPVVTREKLLVGTISIEAMHRRKHASYAAHDRRMGRISDFRSLRVPDCSLSGNWFFRSERNKTNSLTPPIKTRERE